MCRSIRTLFNFEPPVSDDEIRAAALQFVRKVSGFHSPSKSNEPAFLLAVDEIEAASRTLPLLLILFIPIVIGIPHLYQWSHSDIVAHDPVLQHKSIYLNVPFFLIRAGLYFVGWLR